MKIPLHNILANAIIELKEKTIKILKEKYPELVDPNGNFTGAVNTNAMEGGNFRVKWKLRVSYSNIFRRLLWQNHSCIN